MSADRFNNLIRRHAATLDSQQSQPRFGTISSLDPSTHTARVLIQPENTLSGWLPMGALSVGSGTGIASPYNLGDQVLVMPTQGSIEHGVIMCAIYSDAQLPPKSASTPGGQPSYTEAGGFSIVHPSGSAIRINADGSIIISAVTLNVVGNLAVTGMITATQTITSQVDVIGNGTSLHNHTHTDSKGGQTSKPN